MFLKAKYLIILQLLTLSLKLNKIIKIILTIYLFYSLYNLLYIIVYAKQNEKIKELGLWYVIKKCYKIKQNSSSVTEVKYCYVI